MFKEDSQTLGKTYSNFLSDPLRLSSQDIFIRKRLQLRILALVKAKKELVT